MDIGLPLTLEGPPGYIQRSIFCHYFVLLVYPKIPSPMSATGACHGFGDSIICAAFGSGSSASCAAPLRFRPRFPQPLMASFAARASPGSGSTSSASNAVPLRFRPRFPLPLMTSFAARAARATSRSSKLITFAFPSTTDLVDRRTLASSFILTNV